MILVIDDPQIEFVILNAVKVQYIKVRKCKMYQDNVFFSNSIRLLNESIWKCWTCLILRIQCVVINREN